MSRGATGSKRRRVATDRWAKGKEDMANAWLALVCPEAGHFLSLTRGEAII